MSSSCHFLLLLELLEPYGNYLLHGHVHKATRRHSVSDSIFLSTNIFRKTCDTCDTRDTLDTCDTCDTCDSCDSCDYCDSCDFKMDIFRENDTLWKIVKMAHIVKQIEIVHYTIPSLLEKKIAVLLEVIVVRLTVACLDHGKKSSFYPNRF
jgi:hypothetical protein